MTLKKGIAALLRKPGKSGGKTNQGPIAAGRQAEHEPGRQEEGGRCRLTVLSFHVTPAKAGVHGARNWIPAFAGMTNAVSASCPTKQFFTSLTGSTILKRQPRFFASGKLL
jgi:hypothetical protein